MIDKQILATMQTQARAAAAKAYCPYSHYRVGCAILGDDDQIYSGFNIENAAYPVCICAEQTTGAQALTLGVKKFKAILLYTPTQEYAYPCGICRQFLHEHGGNLPIYTSCDLPQLRAIKLDELLPHAFGPHNL